LTSIPGDPFGAVSASFFAICGASIESSLAQTLDTTFTMSIPRSSAIGRARSAMRGPTAARQCARGTGSCFFAKRFSPARSSTSSSGSGASRRGRFLRLPVPMFVSVRW
jgi:hypothetical protein